LPEAGRWQSQRATSYEAIRFRRSTPGALHHKSSNQHGLEKDERSSSDQVSAIEFPKLFVGLRAETSRDLLAQRGRHALS